MENLKYLEMKQCTCKLPRIKEWIRNKIRKIFELYANEKTTYQYLWDTMRQFFNRKIYSIECLESNKWEGLNDPSTTLNYKEKKKLRSLEIINVRLVTNEMKTIKSIKSIKLKFVSFKRSKNWCLFRKTNFFFLKKKCKSLISG